MDEARKQWQATILDGGDEPEPLVTVYGETMVTLREAARRWLVEHKPHSVSGKYDSHGLVRTRYVQVPDGETYSIPGSEDMLDAG